MGLEMEGMKTRFGVGWDHAKFFTTHPPSLNFHLPLPILTLCERCALARHLLPDLGRMGFLATAQRR